MALNWISSRIGSVFPLIAIGLALANWNAKPAAAWAWAAVIVISIVMVAVQRLSQLALSRSPGDAAWIRGVASVDGAVVFGALMVIIPLALTLAHAYGVGPYHQDIDILQRRLTGADHVRNAGSVAGWQFRAIFHNRALGVLAVDIDKRFAKHAGSLNSRFGVFVEERLKILVHPHDNLHGAKRASGDNTDHLHIANGHTLQVHWLPLANSLSVVKVCNERDLAGENSAGPADQEHQQGQGH